MILEILMNLPSEKKEGNERFRSEKPRQARDVVLGELVGKTFDLWVFMRKQWVNMQGFAADFHTAKAQDLRASTDETRRLMRDSADKFNTMARQQDLFNTIFRTQLAEEFSVEEGWCVGVRDGFIAVKYQGEPADRGIRPSEEAAAVMG